MRNQPINPACPSEALLLGRWHSATSPQTAAKEHGCQCLADIHKERKRLHNCRLPSRTCRLSQIIKSVRIYSHLVSCPNLPVMFCFLYSRLFSFDFPTWISLWHWSTELQLRTFGAKATCDAQHGATHRNKRVPNGTRLPLQFTKGGNLWKTLFNTFSVACSFFRWRHQGTSKETWKCSFWERHQLGTHCILSSQIVTCHSEVPKQSTIYRFINTVHVALRLPSCITSKSQFEVKRFLLGWCRFSIFSSSSLAGGLVPQREMVSTLFYFNCQKFGFIIFFHPCWFPNFCTISLFTPVTLP